MKIELYPLEKMVIDGTSIYLGMEQVEVEKILGKGEVVNGCERHFYYDSNLAIDYDTDNRVEFIEFLGGIDGMLHPMIYGVSAFEVMADELTVLLKNENHGKIDGEIGELEKEDSLSFLNIDVGIYRETTPSDVKQMIEEIEAEEDNECMVDIEYEMRRASHWDTIGIGVPGYYLSTLDLPN